MAKKGSAKITKNKALHSKLMERKKNKLRDEKIAHKEKLRAIIKKSQENTNL
jgi:hypothetical protein